MHKRGAQRMAAVTLAVGAALAWANGANAAGAMNIATCQLLSAPNTVYKLTADLATCGDCLIVAADRITIDLQNHAIRSTCPGRGSAITDQQFAYDLIVVKNGAVNGYQIGIVLWGTRASVIGVDASDHALSGIFTGGAKSLIKSCVANNNGLFGVFAYGEGAQVQQCDASNNGFAGMILAAPDCLLTMNSANNNSRDGILSSSDCAVSFNTANANGRDGINTRFTNFPEGTGSLVTQNTAIGNGHTDFVAECPGDEVTFNTSSGLPTSYDFKGSPPCHTAHNR